MNHKYFNAVMALVKETENEDPVDLGYLTINEADAMNLVVSSMCEHWDSVVKNSDSFDDTAITALTIMSKLAYENFILHLRVQNG